MNAQGQITGIGIDPNHRGSYDVPPIISFGGSNQSATATVDLFGGTATVKLNADLPTNQPLTLIFSRPATDYASTDITNLWYSWANYYINQFANFVPPTGITGSIAKGSNVLTLDSSVPDSLRIGMTVSGDGIVPASGTKVTILGFNPDPTTNQIYLSQLSSSAALSGTSYTFGAPQPLPFSNADGVKSITLTANGKGYTPATVTFSGSGSGAAGTVITSNGQVVGVVMTNYGSGYTSPPTVTFKGGSTDATGTATINSDGLLTGVTITSGGSGYLSMDLSGPGSGASAIATVDPVTGSITKIGVINAGSGYNPNNPPTVTISGGGGSGATATATVGSFVTPFTLTFPNDQQAFAQAFAGSVYEALAAESAIPNYAAKNPLLPGAYSLVYTTLGTDVLDLPNAIGGSTPTNGTSRIGTLVTNLIKSVLRGVPDFTNPLYSDQSQWYPNPNKDLKTGEPTGGQQFNVYNLDPYVWFVHTVLKLSGYGFSTDDDTSDVDASASPYTPLNQQKLPNNLRYVFSGLDDLPNQQEWFPGVPWGAIKVQGTIANPTSGPYSKLTVFTLSQTENTKLYYQIAPPDILAGQIGAYVSGPGIPPGTRITVLKRDDSNPNNLLLVLNTQIPNLQSTNGEFTFSGALPSSPSLSGPPPSSSLLGAGGGFSNTLSPVQELAQLAVDEALLTLDQIFALFSTALGFGPNPALAASIADLNNAINANPLTPTLLGREVINLVKLAILNRSTGGGQ